ncbi:hypothetical protein MOUN0_E05490 [Monosporozyma unispora]
MKTNQSTLNSFLQRSKADLTSTTVSSFNSFGSQTVTTNLNPPDWDVRNGESAKSDGNRSCPYLIDEGDVSNSDGMDSCVSEEADFSECGESEDSNPDDDTPVINNKNETEPLEETLKDSIIKVEYNKHINPENLVMFPITNYHNGSQSRHLLLFAQEVEDN